MHSITTIKADICLTLSTTTTTTDAFPAINIQQAQNVCNAATLPLSYERRSLY
jgi:hypothetical protein